MDPLPWQLQIVRKSLKKKEKIDLIRKDIPVAPADVLLDLGCAQGILSYFLRQKGGFWVSADLDFTNLKSSQALLGHNLVQMGETALPFKDGAFDQVVCLDYLEHVDDDDLTLRRNPPRVERRAAASSSSRPTPEACSCSRRSGRWSG